MTKIGNCHMTELNYVLLFNFVVVNDDVMMMIQWKDIF